MAVHGGTWPVGVETADGDLTLELSSGALATSGRDRRRWRRNGRELHHLIDPKTGTPSDSDLLRLTVVASDAVEAEVWAKALYLHGRGASRSRSRRARPAVRARHRRRAHAARGRPPMRDPTFWILARASGLTAYVLLTMSVLAGLVLKSRPFGRALSAAAVTDTHRFLALLGLGAVALHGLTLVLDSTVHISLAGAPRAGARALPAGLDGARRPRRGADGS